MKNFQHDEAMPSTSSVSRRMTEDAAAQINDLLGNISEEKDSDPRQDWYADEQDKPQPPQGSPAHDAELRQIAFVEDVANQFIAMHLEHNRGEPNYAFTGTLKKAVEALVDIAIHPADDRAYIKVPQILALLRESID